MVVGSETLRIAGADGVSLAADSYGDPGRPCVLLLHGGGQTRHAWAGTAVGLAEQGWHAVVMDQRGHGDSDWADDGDYSFDAFRRDVVAAAAELGAPVLVGASLGGLASMLAIAESDEPVARGLVLVDIAAKVERAGAERVLAFMRAKPEGFASLEEAADAVAAYLPHRKRPKDLGGLAKNLRKQRDGRYRWHWDPRFMTSRTESPETLRFPERLDAAARGLSLPTLLVRGRLSDILTEEGASHFMECVPHARFVDVADADHMVAGDRNDVFTRSVVDFLRDGLAA